MLSLFKEETAPVSRDFALGRARELLVSYLNKGIIPNWENFFQELPTLNNAEDFEAIKGNFLKLTRWTFLEDILKSEATEFFFHSPERSQILKLNGVKENFSVPLNKDDWQLWLEILSIHFRQNWNVQ